MGRHLSAHMGKKNVLGGDDESNSKAGATMSTPGGGTGHGLGVEQKVAAADNKSRLQAEPPIPADTSCFSTALLTWIWPFIRKGADLTYALTDEDVPQLPPGFEGFRERASGAVDQVGSEVKVSVLSICWDLFGWEVVVGFVLSFFHGLTVTVARPLLLREIIAEVDRDLDQAFFLTGMLGVTLLCEGVLACTLKHVLGERLGAQFVMTACSLLQRKALKLENKSAGSQASMISTDVVQVFEMLKFMGWVPSAFVSLIGGTAVVVFTIGEAGLIGMSVIGLVIIISFVIAKRNNALRGPLLALTDTRSSLVTHVVEGIKAIKLNVWELDYEKMILGTRTDELEVVKTVQTSQFVGVQLGRAAPALAACFSFVYVGMIKQDELEAQDVFASLTVFMSLRVAIIMIPLSLTMAGMVQGSFERIDRFLNLNDAQLFAAPEDQSTLVEIRDADFSYGITDAAAAAKSAKAAEELNDVENALQLGPVKSSRDVALQDVNLKITKGSLTAVVGSVGSGKSSLLSAILSELELCKGSCKVDRSSVGYTPQSSFVVHGSIMENVTMGTAFDADRFDKVAQATCLKEDLENMVDGMNTEIGERGVTLSGGQQARVAIARAVYGKPSLLLLDDPLAAVDFKVANHIMEHGVLPYTKAGGTIVMVMNQLHLLSNFDCIIHVKDGRIVETGTYSDLMTAGGAFRDLLDELNVGALKIETVEDGGTLYSPRRKKALNEEPAIQLVQAEKKATGDVNDKVMHHYIRAAGYGVAISGISVCFIAYGFMLFGDRWLAEWVTKEAQGDDVDNDFYGSIYLGTNFFFCLFSLLCSFILIFGGIRAGRNIHADIISKLLHTPLSFFESNPSGRILSRLVTDMATVDMYQIGFTDAMLTFAITTFVVCLQICLIMPLATAIMVFAFGIFVLQAVAVERTSRQVKRMANNRTSGMLTTFSESVTGRASISAMQMDDFFTDRFDKDLERYAQGIFVAGSMGNWSMLISFFSAFMIAVPTAFVMLAYHEEIDTALLGLALTYLLSLPYFLQQVAFILNIFLGNLTSLERLLQYTDKALPQEPEWFKESDPEASSWPTKGEIRFTQVTLRYQPSLPPALDNLDLVLKGGQKTGVIGRTGAGKSTVMSCLFRLVDPVSGTVHIDGKNICEIGLHTLREAMRIIPQHPLLMSGTVRNNLDPFKCREDQELLVVLAKVGLDSELLDTEIGQGASALSSGERQLLTFARVLLSDAKIICMDEPTSNIDAKTDEFVQKVVREEFVGRTVITIAHRLQSVIDYDNIAVMQKGKLAEFGSPMELLSDQNSHFSSMLSSLGAETASKLKIAASRAHQAHKVGITPMKSIDLNSPSSTMEIQPADLVDAKIDSKQEQL